MKTRLFTALLLGVSMVLLQGCISIPPLVQVQHKSENGGDIQKRLESIERRLDSIERRMERAPEKAPDKT